MHTQTSIFSVWISAHGDKQITSQNKLIVYSPLKISSLFIHAAIHDGSHK